MTGGPGTERRRGCRGTNSGRGGGSRSPSCGPDETPEAQKEGARGVPRAEAGLGSQRWLLSLESEAYQEETQTLPKKGT